MICEIFAMELDSALEDALIISKMGLGQKISFNVSWFSDQLFKIVFGEVLFRRV